MLSHQENFAGWSVNRVQIAVPPRPSPRSKPLKYQPFLRWHDTCKATGVRRLGEPVGVSTDGLAWERGAPVKEWGAEPMENTLLIGLSRQMVLQRELDVVANNVANLNTTGFKADANIFHEHLMPVARAERFRGADRRLSYVIDHATWHNFSKGPVQQTGNPLDLALDGKAFLAVDTPRGERYTRNGALQVNAQGELVTNEGHRVLGESGPIVFQIQDRDISVARDGTITVREGVIATNQAVRGKLRLVAFGQPERLRKDGTSLFVAPDGVAPEAADPNAAIVQGAIEKSNVLAVAEVTRMIEVTRSYTAIAGMLQQNGELRRSAIERLAEVPA
jgi:flagellar basal-body rod protein FlgF